MYLNKELVREFVTKQDMGGHDDEVMQFKCIRKELDELNVDWVMNIHQSHPVRINMEAEIEEMADVLVTLLVFARMRGYLDSVSEAFEKKMEENVRKPVREGKGEKVRKGRK